MLRYILLTASLTTITPTLTLAAEVSHGLLDKLRSQGKADAVLELPSVMNTVLSNPMLKILSGDAKTDFMTGLMKEMTTSAQAPFLRVLKNFGVEDIQPLWITNKVSMRGVGFPVVNAINALPGIFTLREPILVQLVHPIGRGSNSSTAILKDVGGAWGVQKIGAPSVWNKTNGKGVVVANIDTGVDGSHPALKNWGNQWYDVVGKKKEPYDDNGHGTHTMGTICGTMNDIGVAPGATWMACKAMGKSGGGVLSWISECAQWLLTVRPLPVVVSNSWGIPSDSNSTSGKPFFTDEISAWRVAGIIPVFSAGNRGWDCGSTGTPGDNPNVISVGATGTTDAIEGFSSHGSPKGNKQPSPSLSAPGRDILSAYPGGGYHSLSGTSMATPHVAGSVALMKADNPRLTYDQVLQSLERTADRSKVNDKDLKCSKDPSQQYPNNAYGYGRINVAKAMRA